MNHLFLRRAGACIVAGLIAAGASAAEPRARDLGVPFEGKPGPLNAITDVRGGPVAEGNVGGGTGMTFIAFSTANASAAEPKGLPALTMLPNERITPFFAATVQATEEAIINALVAARTTEGFGGHRAIELPLDRLRAALKKYNRLEPQ
jgi:L-aminopeptidase/D-esterase-like protein